MAHVKRSRVEELAADERVMWVEPPLPALTEVNDGSRPRGGSHDGDPTSGFTGADV